MAASISSALSSTVVRQCPAPLSATISEAEYLRFSANRKERGNEHVPLDLILADGRTFPHKGKIVFFDRAMDTKTGTFSVVAEFPNPGGLLRPGQFGRVRAAAETVENALIIPKRAVLEIQGMKTVLVVGADNTVALRTIQPAETVGEYLIVRDGVKPGDRVIVEGLQKARPGTKVNPTTAPVAATTDVKAGVPANATPSGAKPVAKPGAK